MITVFTPTYNRAYILPKLYQSLRTQTNNNFEWLIIDDGSTDETEGLVKSWISENSLFSIRYQKQPNGGKHRAINRGVQLAKGELFFIVDSDDFLTDDAIDTVLKWESELKKENKKFCGVAGERASINSGQTLGTSYCEDYVDATALDREKYNIYGDKAEVFYTDVLRKYPFPEIDGENFITESVVWYRMANAGYLMRWFNTPIYMCEYREDGLTHQGNEIFAKNPIGYALSVRERCEFRKATVKGKIFAAYYFCDDLKSRVSVPKAIQMLGFQKYYIFAVYAQKFNVLLHKWKPRKQRN